MSQILDDAYTRLQMLGVDFNQDIPFIDLCVESPMLIKKNSQSIGFNPATKLPTLFKNKIYQQGKKPYLKSLIFQKLAWQQKLGNIFPITGPIILSYVFQVNDLRLADLSNLVEAPNDFMQSVTPKRKEGAGIIDNDSQIVSYLPPIRILKRGEPEKTFIRIYYNLNGVNKIIEEKSDEPKPSVQKASKRASNRPK